MTPYDKPDWTEALRDEETVAAWLAEADTPAQPKPAADDRDRLLRARDFARACVAERCREIAGVVRFWSVCDLPACRRSRACRSAAPQCFDEQADEMRDRLEDLLEWPRLDGPLDDAALDALAADFRKLGAPI
jgi:hypothetical protein